MQPRTLEPKGTNLNKQTLGPRAYLKKQGVIFGKSIRALDRAFLNSFPEDKRPAVEDVWERIHLGLSTVKELYDLPRTREQISLLVSHDAPRMCASLNWFKSAVAHHKPASIIEFGCGAGYLLGFLRHSHPDLTLAGVERQSNLARLVEEDERLTVFEGDYRELAPVDRYDLVVCDFGWDNHDIPASTSPHSDAEVAGYPYCPGCSDDEMPFFTSMLAEWKRWAKPEAPLVVAGRLMDVIDLRAFVLAAEQVGWHLWTDRSGQLVVANLAGETEDFPALSFSAKKKMPAIAALEQFLITNGRQ